MLSPKAKEFNPVAEFVISPISAEPTTFKLPTTCNLSLGAFVPIPTLSELPSTNNAYGSDSPLIDESVSVPSELRIILPSYILI